MSLPGRAAARAGVWALLISASACGPADPIRTDPPAGYPNAYAMSDCAPWDGPATTIYLSSNEAEPDGLPGSEIAPPLVWVSVYQPRDALPGEGFDIDQGSIAGAMRCPSEGFCEPAAGGRIRFGPPATRMAGDLVLDFHGDTISGGFDAAWVDRRVLCG